MVGASAVRGGELAVADGQLKVPGSPAAVTRGQLVVHERWGFVRLRRLPESGDARPTGRISVRDGLGYGAGSCAEVDPAVYG